MSKKDYLIIERSKWRTGNLSSNRTGKGDTELLNGQGYMCCLGFRCHQMGIPKKDLLHRAIPRELSGKWDIPDLVNSFGYNTRFTRVAMTINDSIRYTSKTREEKIKEHFAKIGVTVEFTGNYI